MTRRERTAPSAVSPRRAERRREPEGSNGVRRVLAIRRAGEPLPGTGASLGDASLLRTVTYDGLEAVVRDDDETPLAPTRENLLEHVHTVDALARQTTLLPLSFGTLLASDADVAALLASGQETFKKTLARLAGQVEYAVRLDCARNDAARLCEGEDEDLRMLGRAILRQEGHPFLRLQYERRLQQVLAAGVPRVQSRLSKMLAPLEARVRFEPLLGDRALIQAAVLLPRSREAQLVPTLHRLARDLGGATVRCVGPSAPYSFVSLRVRVGRDVAAE